MSFRDYCSDSVGWNPEIRRMPDLYNSQPTIDENGNELPFQDRLGPPNPLDLIDPMDHGTFEAFVKCPNFPTPCTDVSGNLKFVQDIHNYKIP